jgi:hypothetical protein
MPRPTENIARAIARLRDQIRDQQETNQPPERLTVSESTTETVTATDATSTTVKTGSDRYLTYDQDSYDFSEYQ